MVDFAKLKEAAAAVAQTAPDMNKSVKGGGGNYTPPPEGIARLRLVGYVETGTHKKSIKGKDKLEKEVRLVFELSGPKYPARDMEDGTKVPFRISINTNFSLNEKAGFYKLFKRMNYKGTATHMSQLLGEAFLGKVVHVTKGEGQEAVTYANLKDDAGYTVTPPKIEDPETGAVRDIEVAPPISPLRMFVWNGAPEHLKMMWDSLFIDGTVGDEQRSLNVFQDRIKAAEDYVGSPIYNLLQAGGQEPDLPGVDTAPGKPAADPLDDV